MLEKDQAHFKNLAVFTQQHFYSMFGHFSKLCMKGLRTFLELETYESRKLRGFIQYSVF